MPQSTLARAVVPVIGGVVFFAVMGLILWGAASLLARNPEDVSERLAPTVFEVGNTENIARIIDEDGPLLFQGLTGAEGERSIVLDHTGDDPDDGWRAYYAYPADRAPTCLVEQVRGTRQFTDCEGRTIETEQLAPPPGVKVIVGDKVSLDLRGATTATAPATTAPATTAPATTAP
jgi:hypothetical protein